MCKQTFNAILDRLMDALSRENTRFRDAIAPDLRLGIGLYALFHGLALRPLGLLFGVGTSTAHESRDIVVNAVVAELYSVSVTPPRGGEPLQRTVDGFQRLGMPNCIGALDGTHFRIVDRGIKYYHDYWCYKHFLSVLAVVRLLVPVVLSFARLNAAQRRPLSLAAPARATAEAAVLNAAPSARRCSAMQTSSFPTVCTGGLERQTTRERGAPAPSRRFSRAGRSSRSLGITSSGPDLCGSLGVLCCPSLRCRHTSEYLQQPEHGALLPSHATTTVTNEHPSRPRPPLRSASSRTLSLTARLAPRHTSCLRTMTPRFTHLGSSAAPGAPSTGATSQPAAAWSGHSASSRGGSDPFSSWT